MKRLLSLLSFVCLFIVGANATIVVEKIADHTTDYSCYDLAISPDGNTLYAAETGTKTIRMFNAKTLEAGSYLAAPGTGNSYGGCVAVDANGAIYGTYAIIAGSTSMKIFKWATPNATPVVFKDLGSASTYGIDNNPYRAGYSMDVRVDAYGNGFILYPSPTMEIVVKGQVLFTYLSPTTQQGLHSK